MSIVFKLSRRNLEVFFRERSAVFFSFLSVIIIILLYALFLADTQAKSIVSLAGDMPGIRFLVDSWIMAGLLAVNTVTLPLGALAVMVRDQDKKLLRDFMVAPVKRASIVASYMIAALAVNIIISVVGFIVMEIYILASGGSLLTAFALLKAMGILLLCIISSTSIMFFMSTFLKDMNAFGTLSTIIGTMIGFLAGIYVPVGVLPQTVQTLIKCFPISHGAVLLRQVFMEEPLRIVFANAPESALLNYQKFFAVTFDYNGNVINTGFMLAFLGVSAVVFIALSIFRVAHMRAK